MPVDGAGDGVGVFCWGGEGVREVGEGGKEERGRTDCGVVSGGVVWSVTGWRSGDGGKGEEELTHASIGSAPTAALSTICLSSARASATALHTVSHLHIHHEKKSNAPQPPSPQIVIVILFGSCILAPTPPQDLPWASRSAHSATGAR